MTQGKRIGGMIVGSMSDPTAAHRLDSWRPGGGLDRYETPETQDDIACLCDPFDPQPERLYLACRRTGKTHAQAMARVDKYWKAI